MAPMAAWGAEGFGLDQEEERLNLTLSSPSPCVGIG